MAPPKLHGRVRNGLPELHGRIRMVWPKLHGRFCMVWPKLHGRFRMVWTKFGILYWDSICSHQICTVGVFWHTLSIMQETHWKNLLEIECFIWCQFQTYWKPNFCLYGCKVNLPLKWINVLLTIPPEGLHQNIFLFFLYNFFLWILVLWSDIPTLTKFPFFKILLWHLNWIPFFIKYSINRWSTLLGAGANYKVLWTIQRLSTCNNTYVSPFCSPFFPPNPWALHAPSASVTLTEASPDPDSSLSSNCPGRRGQWQGETH